MHSKIVKLSEYSDMELSVRKVLLNYAGRSRRK